MAGEFQKSAIDYRCITVRHKVYVSLDLYLSCNIQWVTQLMISALSCVSLDQAVQIIMNNGNDLGLGEICTDKHTPMGDVASCTIIKHVHHGKGNRKWAKSFFYKKIFLDFGLEKLYCVPIAD